MEQILRYNVKSILYCGRQCVAFRTRNKGKWDGMNQDNFIAFLKFLGEYDEILQTHLISSPIKKAIFCTMTPKATSKTL